MKTKSLLAITAIVTASFAANATGDKVKINHKGKMINVSENALEAHLDHGDVQLFAFRGSFLSQTQINAILSSEYQQYQDATAEDEEWEANEGGAGDSPDEL